MCKRAYIFLSDEIKKIKGLKTDQIEKVLGYANKSEIVHRDDMVKRKNEIPKIYWKKANKASESLKYVSHNKIQKTLVNI